MEELLIFGWLAWIFPIVGALLTPLLAKIGDKVRDYGAVFFSFMAVVSTVSLSSYLFKEHVEWPLHNSIVWLSVEGSPILSEIRAGILVDPLSIIMSNVVSIIAFLIMVYSLGYMKNEEGLTRYWFFMNLFIGNMLLLVFSDNLIQMLFGWEGVGLCSYGLIGFYYKDSKDGWKKYWVGEGDEAYPPSHAGLKAFIMTRFGDLLLFVGAFIILAFAGTLNFVELQNGAISRVPVWALLPAIIFFFGGPIGKSAQLPLMEWLPDAMAGPTTVSALIHAATMVKAGVYLVARMFPILYATKLASDSSTLVLMFYFIAWIGVLTSFVAGTQAMVSRELKKVLAYSTVSQIGYMMMALGIAGISVEFITGYVGSIFHLMSHALFKAALFLAAGSVIHATGSRFMYDMGGLKKYMPITFWCMAIASCSLAGVPILSGFWSKDMILEASLISGEYLLLFFALSTVIVTSFYTFRMIGLVFYGQSVKEQEHEHHLHEAPAIMWVPYAILVAGTLILGVGGYFVRHWLIESFEYLMVSLHGEYVGDLTAEYLISFLSVMCVIIGFVPAYIFYIRRSKSFDLSSKAFSSKIWTFLAKRWYINKLYYSLFVYPTVSISNWLYENLESRVVDGLNYYIASLAKQASVKIRKVQSGNFNDSLTLFLLGVFVAVIILCFIILG
ncbi:MAG: NADH-quinone oxidoreductase subunit L [Nitrososphaeria archaeon]|nr:NADH-quinone oxidoreductase subunit L [Nitrososphaeria archaeon]